MKKLIALIAVLLVASGIVLAADTGPGSNTYVFATTNVYNQATVPTNGYATLNVANGDVIYLVNRYTILHPNGLSGTTNIVTATLGPPFRGLVNTTANKDEYTFMILCTASNKLTIATNSVTFGRVTALAQGGAFTVKIVNTNLCVISGTTP